MTGTENDKGKDVKPGTGRPRTRIQGTWQCGILGRQRWLLVYLGITGELWLGKVGDNMERNDPTFIAHLRNEMHFTQTVYSNF